MNLVEITDPADPRLADYRDLTDVALRRRAEPERGLYIAESAKVISRALRAGHEPRSVLIQDKWRADVAALLVDHPDAIVYLVSAELAETLTGYAVHRGALAAMQRPEMVDPAAVLAAASRVVILEDIVDHTNVGAIFRACAGLGADAVLITPRCADPLYRRSVRVSMGTVFQVPWTRLPEWSQARELLHAYGYQIAALALSEEAVPLERFAPASKVALVLGAEGDGLSAAALSAADTVVTIPMDGGVDSLNVAAASAVALWALRSAAG
ncbi:RNA methyltransferase [Microbacterium sediminicola]|uniref:RNA methyltransferase n=1 Tax=Microbacterium sediminicola TaxID=415210 RepID=A0ABP4TW66_9MICO